MERLAFARHLRHEMTPTEKRLWKLLRANGLGYRFRRQVPRGPYILDFACLERRLVIELDGGQHADSEKDVIRDAWLAARGFRVLRFWNRELLHNLDGVHRRIEEALSAPMPPPQSNTSS